MLTKFYSNTIKTKFIKNLIASTYIPIVGAWKPGDFVVEGMSYVSKFGILKALKTGNPNNLVVTENGERIAYFNVISPYVFGQYYECIAGQYRSNIQGYDEKTHYLLGQYLRYLRDIQDLDLMPFYNCATNNYLSDIDFDLNGDISVTTGIEGYKIMSIPIKFNSKYMIGVECGTPIYITPIIYSERGYIQDATEELQNIISSKGEYGVVLCKRNTSLRSPFIYSTPSFTASDFTYTANDDKGFGFTNENDKSKNAPRMMIQYEKYLRLLIKMPISCNSSVVVIEGDYEIGSSDFRDTSNVSILNDATTVNHTTPDMANRCIAGSPKYYTNKQLLSPLSLLQINDGTTYAFSDRLIEYLLWNVITPLDEIGEDIQRVQEYVGSNTFATKNNTPVFSAYNHLGLWNDNLRVFLYQLMVSQKSGANALDLAGYVDKDTEQLIMRGQQLICRNNSKW